MVIELGTDWEPPESAPPGRTGRRGRGATALGLCLLLLLTMVDSVRPHTGWRLAASIPAHLGDQYLLSGDVLVLAHAVVPGQATQLDGYALPGGRRLWRYVLPARLNQLTDKGPGLLLVQSDDGGDPAHGSLTALDTATGRQLWSASGDAVFDYPGPTDADTVVTIDATSATGQLRQLDVHSGAVRWSLDVPEPRSANVLVSSGRVVIRSADGLVRVFDERTGLPLVTGRLAAAPPSESTEFLGPSLFVFGPWLVDLRALVHGSSITSYDLATLTYRWRMTVVDKVRYIADCGSVLCLDTGYSLTGIDPVTSARRWSTTGWTLASAGGPRVMASGLGGRRRFLVDPATGEAVLDLDGWQALDAIRPGTPTLLMSGRADTPGVWIGALSGDQTRVVPQTYLPRVINQNCGLDPTSRKYLACLTIDGPVHVWVNRPLPG